MTEQCDMALLVQADFDGELDAAQAASLAAHREACPICRATYLELRQLRDRFRSEVTDHRPSAALREAVIQRLAAAAPPTGTAEPRPARARAWPWRAAASFVAGAALAASVTLMVVPADQGPMLADQVVASHIRSLEPGNQAGVISTDRHTVKPWFDGKLDYAPPVKDLTAEGFPLLSGRLDYLDGRPVAALGYARAKHQINLFLWPDRGADLAPRFSQRDGYNVIHWRRDGLSLWAVSDVEKSELEAFVHLWNDSP
jgi:anti-sigma factor RsiW